jgi:hypothetical protein
MSHYEDSKPSAVGHLDKHHNKNNQNNNNNEGLNLNDFVETEDYEPMDPDGLDQKIINIKIIEIFSCSHDDFHVLLEHPHVSLVLLQL